MIDLDLNLSFRSYDNTTYCVSLTGVSILSTCRFYFIFYRNKMPWTLLKNQSMRTIVKGHHYFLFRTFFYFYLLSMTSSDV